jgi:hypothetical protein
VLSEAEVKVIAVRPADSSSLGSNPGPHKIEAWRRPHRILGTHIYDEMSPCNDEAFEAQLVPASSVPVALSARRSPPRSRSANAKKTPARRSS